MASPGKAAGRPTFSRLGATPEPAESLQRYGAGSDEGFL